MKRLVCLSGMGASKLFSPLFEVVTRADNARMKLTADDVLLFEGGTDVNPKYYGQRQGRYTDSPDIVRDARERALWLAAQEVGAASIGICRGSQFLTVMNDGELIQHVTGHCQSHRIRTNDGGSFEVTSTHHQMMVPLVEHQMLAWSAKPLSNVYLDGNDVHCPEKVFGWREPEIVWYPKSKSLCIQGHPEYVDSKEIFPQYCLRLVRKFILSGEKE